MIKGWIRKMNRLATFVATAVLVTACGGGGGTEDNGTGFVPAAPPQGAKINITLTDLEGNEITEISPIKSGTFLISAKNSGGDPIAQAVVTGTTTIGRMIPESGTALTGDDGVATLYVAADGVDGAGTLTAGMTFNEVESEGSISFSVTTKIPAETRKLGHINASGDFVEGVIKVEPSGQISAGGTAALTLVVVDENLEPVATQESLTFNSNCLFGDLALLDPPSPVTLGSKTTVNFTADGCEGDEIITATLASSGAEATGTVSIAPIQGEIISFEEEKTATKLIAIRGTGSASDLPEFANVYFRVTDGFDNPAVNARVNFSLIQAVGDSALACESLAFCEYASEEDEAAGRSSRFTDQTGVDGYVSARVLSGSVASPTQLLAYVDLNDNGERDPSEPSTVSKVLVVSTGVADQNSITLSAWHLNPYGSRYPEYNPSKSLCGSINDSYYSGSLEVDGLCTDVIVRLADKYNNPVPDGTAATLTTEYGRIQGSCVTQAGNCSVVWNSQNPRSSATVDQYSAPITINENLDASTPNRYNCPSHNVDHGPCPDDIADPEVNPPGAPRGGRSTVTLVVNGEESFIDRDGNGYYDEGEFWTNLTEAFTDHNEDGLYTPAQRANCLDPATADDVCLAGFEEIFFDFNSNGVFDLNNTPAAPAGSSLPDGLYNGVLCREEDEAAGICSRELLHLSQSIEIILSPDEQGYEFLLVDRNRRESGNTLYGGNTYQMYISDQYNNPPPGLTEIEVTGGGGCSVINEKVIVPLPSDSKPGAYAFSFAVATDIESELSASDPDQVVVKITLPNRNSIIEIYRCPVERACDPDGSSFSPTCGG